MESGNRLIIVPQYPTKLRYQEWWYTEFPKRFAPYFEEIVVLGQLEKAYKHAKEGSFAPVDASLHFELAQIQEFTDMKLHADDTLLLNDLSFPGLFANVLFHKKPRKCFVICHATSKNRYDLFASVRRIKYPIECKQASLFDTVFVGSKYHANKLGWENIHIVRLPNYPVWMQPKKLIQEKKRLFARTSRPNMQKVTKKMEKAVESFYKTKIYQSNVYSWKEYFQFLQETKFLLITSKEETYGYQVIDALMNGCIPLAPKRYSYPELLPKECLYNSFPELTHRVAFWSQQSVLPAVPEEDFFKITSNIMKEE